MAETETHAQKVDDLHTLVDYLPNPSNPPVTNPDANGSPKPEYSTAKQVDLVNWRRIQVLKLRAKGYTIDEIVDILRAGHRDVRISHGTVHNDLKAMREQTRLEISRYIEDLAFEHRLATAGITEVIKKAWVITESARGDRDRIAALALVKEAIVTKQTILGDSDILKNALSFTQKAKQKLQEQEQGQ